MIDGILGGALGAAGGLLGGLSSNRKLKKQMKMINELKKDNQNWYDRRYNEDATQRADAQAMLTRTNELLKNRNKAAAGAAAVMGGSDESIAAEKAANANVLANVASNIAVEGERRKEAIESDYRKRNDELEDAMMKLKGQKKNFFDILSDTAGGAAAGLGSIVE